MTVLAFWQGWPRPYRLVFFTSISVLIISTVSFIWTGLTGLENVVAWQVLSELIDRPAPLRTFTDGLLDYTIPGRAYLVAEQFVTAPAQARPDAAFALLLALGIALTLLLTGLTRLNRQTYLVAMSGLIGGLSVMGWSFLDVAGLNGQVVYLCVIGLLGGVSYWFHAFRSGLYAPVRLAVFGGLVAGLFLMVGLLSRASEPAMIVISYGMPVVGLVALGFIFFIAIDIMAGLVWLTSANRVGSQPLGFGNLLGVSGLYFLNLILLWLRNTTIIDWDVLTISPFVIYLISGGLGLWGVRRWCEQRAEVSYRDAGVWLYLSGAICTTAIIAYAFATANDPLIEVFEDMIVYAHLAMGLLFLLYVALNFRDLYAQRLAVYKVLYTPRRGVGPGVRLGWFRLAGLIVTGLLFSNANFFSVRQAIAGYYNGLGDLNLATHEPVAAEAFYQLALQHDYRNRKTNVALATLAQQQNNPATAAQYWEQSLLKQPSPQAYIALSQTFLTANLFFDGIKVLQRGLRAFPQNGELQNNLGYLYARTSVADSAYFYLQTATEHAHQSDVAQTNLLAFWARNPTLIAADSSVVAVTDKNYAAYRANALALRRLGLLPAHAFKLAQAPAWLTKSDTTQPLPVGQFAELYNHSLLTTNPDAILTKQLQKLAQNSANQDVADDLILARAVAEYNRHDPATAFGLLAELAQGNGRSGATYRQTAGLLMLEQGLFGSAASVFFQNPDTLSGFYRAMALTKAGRLAESKSVWEIAAQTDPLVRGLKQTLFQEKLPTTDLEKAVYVSYRIDDLNRGKVWQTIADPNLYTAAGAALLEDYIQTRQPFYAAMILSQLKPASLLNAVGRSLQTLSAVRVAVARRNGKAALSLATDAVLPQHEPERQRLMGQAYLLLHQLNSARQAFTQAARLAPLNAQTVSNLATMERQQRQTGIAYRRVVAALAYHDSDPGLLKLYVQLCLDQGLTQYADDGLLRLELATTSADYQVFFRVYQARLTWIEKQRQAFGQ